MLIQDIGQIRKLIMSVPGTLVGVGMTAFSRGLPASFLDKYRIMAFKKTEDLPILRRKTDIFCLEEETESLFAKTPANSEALLLHPQSMAYLNGISGPKNLFLYQDYPQLRCVAKANGWRRLANSSRLRMEAAKRAFFKEMVLALRLPKIAGNLYPIGVIQERAYEEWCLLVGPRLVVQLPDIVIGGGRGTFFVSSREDYQRLQERLKENYWRSIRLKTVSVHRFVKGISSSVVACVTRQGTLVSALQRQLMDLPYCGGFAEDGVFCGHSWGAFPWTEAVRESAYKQACRIGEYVGALGYKGILGIDFVVQNNKGKVFPIEINPRLTGALPMLSLLHLQAGIIPMEAFHLLEFLNVPYRIDQKRLNRRYAEPVKGSHLVIFDPLDEEKSGFAATKAGLYEKSPGENTFQFLRETLDYGDIKNENQFIMADGPWLRVGQKVIQQDSHSRFCRLLFSYPVADNDGHLLPHALSAANWVRSKKTRVEGVS